MGQYITEERSDKICGELEGRDRADGLAAAAPELAK